MSFIILAEVHASSTSELITELHTYMSHCRSIDQWSELFYIVYRVCTYDLSISISTRKAIYICLHRRDSDCVCVYVCMNRWCDNTPSSVEKYSVSFLDCRSCKYRFLASFEGSRARWRNTRSFCCCSVLYTTVYVCVEHMCVCVSAYVCMYVCK